ncbi:MULTISPECIES: hypothetical protein [Mycobacteriaceae]|uniref:hypothetical protein n=1 Tax=Mycobacteriaceae TaxID=1762 RepID=UPI000991CBE9|nr:MULTISPECIES: hypothetical protein [Mycobacteriaceae]MDO3058495.1 hypothetical protein [Mycobacteroides abscessus subsp. abscessus]MDO3277969.1 hypothetical protein [Mycobacteroides abscessus subsp. abscessus]
MRPPAEPLVVVWRNQIPHRCTLIHWGRKWKYTDHEHRLINLRRVHVWSAHSPVIGGEVVSTRTPKARAWHNIAFYQADGKPMILGAPSSRPEYSIADWPDE